MRSLLLFVATVLVLCAILLGVHATMGAEVGEPCTDFLFSCRGTRGPLTLNGCLHEGPGAGQSYCSYACREVADCPDGWSCDPAWGYATVSAATDDVDRVCVRPAR